MKERNDHAQHTEIHSAIYTALAESRGAGSDGSRCLPPPDRQGLDADCASHALSITGRTAETYRRTRRAYQAFAPQGEALTADFISQEILDQLSEPGPAITDEIEVVLNELRPLIPLLPGPVISWFDSLPQLDAGAESEVRYDTSTGLVCKLLLPSRDTGRIGGGYTPGQVYEDGKPDSAPTHLLEYVARTALNNEQGGQVLTEIVGTSPDGRLMVLQPYIRGLRPADFRAFGYDWRKIAGMDRAEQLQILADMDARRAMLMQRLGLVPIGPETAVGWAQGKAIVVDLHDNNLMVDELGVPYIIDSTSRELTREEMNVPRVRDALAKAKGLQSTYPA